MPYPGKINICVEIRKDKFAVKASPKILVKKGHSARRAAGDPPRRFVCYVCHRTSRTDCTALRFSVDEVMITRR